MFKGWKPNVVFFANISFHLLEYITFGRLQYAAPTRSK